MVGDEEEPVVLDPKTGVVESTYTGFGDIVNNMKTKLIKNDAFKQHGMNENGISVFQLNLKVSAGGIGDPKSKEKTTTSDILHWYISLDKLIEIVNKEIEAQAKSVFSKVYCDTETTLGDLDPWVKSPAPQHIIFPGKHQGDYTFDEIAYLANNPTEGVDGSKLIAGINEKIKAGAAAGVKPAVNPNVLKFNNEIADKKGENFIFDQADSVVYLGGILININTVQSVQNLAGKTDTLNNFLGKIFNLIFECSGGVYDLTMIPQINTTTGITDNLIVNKNYSTYTHSSLASKIVVFKPFGTSSVVRDMSLSAEIPEALATQAYVSTRGAKGGAQSTSYPAPVTGLFTNQCVGAPKPVTDLTKINAQKLKNLVTILFGYYKYPRVELEIKQFDSDMTGEQQSISKALTVYKTLGDNDLKKWNKNILLPLKFGVTIDGINGFKFGDVITTTYLPTKYKTDIGGFRAVFTITKVNHSISGNDWTTTLETVCRLSV